MKKLKAGLIVFGIFFTFSGYAQEEFFEKNTGLSASYSFEKTGNSDDIGDSQLSLHFKNGLILAGDYFKISNSDFYGGSIGYLINNNDNNKLKALLGLSYGQLSDEFNRYNQYKIFVMSFGLVKILFPNSNFPSSFHASTSVNIFFYDRSYSYLQPTATFGYSQCFFVNNVIYPVIGISKSILLFNNSSSGNNRDFNIHVGLNIKLSEPEKPKKEIN
ncbi:MAG: hypothetical protein WCK78_16070 [Paludibacter sp.]